MQELSNSTLLYELESDLTRLIFHVIDGDADAIAKIFSKIEGAKIELNQDQIHGLEFAAKLALKLHHKLGDEIEIVLNSLLLAQDYNSKLDECMALYMRMMEEANRPRATLTNYVRFMLNEEPYNSLDNESILQIAQMWVRDKQGKPFNMGTLRKELSDRMIHNVKTMNDVQRTKYEKGVNQLRSFLKVGYKPHLVKDFKRAYDLYCDIERRRDEMKKR